MLIAALSFAACGGAGDTPAERPTAGRSDPGSSAQADPSTSPGGDDDGSARSSGDKVTVMVIDTAFEPSPLTVKTGTEVTWKQIGDQPHSVTSVDGTFDSSPKCRPLESERCDFEGDTYSFTFDEPGTYDYYCRIHGLPTGRGMFATITVED